MTWQVSSWCLSYPDDQFIDRISLLRRALCEQPDHPSTRELLTFVDHLESTPLPTLVDDYVETFDLSRKHTLALTNRGDARAADILELARHVRAGVREALLVANATGTPRSCRVVRVSTAPGIAAPPA